MSYENGVSNRETSGLITIASPTFALAAGRSIVVGIHAYLDGAQYVVSVTDTAGNTYVRCGNREVLGNGTDEVWLARGTKAHATNIITVTYDRVATYRGVLAAIYTDDLNYDTGAALVQTNDALTHTTGTADINFANELLVAWVTDIVSMAAYGNGTGTVRVTIDDALCLADRVVSTKGTYSVSVTTGNNTGQACTLRTFSFGTAGALRNRCVVTHEGAWS